jgi:hypothetical protein
MDSVTARPKPWRPLCIRGPGHIAIACVPKVAQTAIKDAVVRAHGIQVRRLERVHQVAALNLCQAHEAAQEGYRVFAFVRDPFDRLVSLWAHRVKGGRHGFNAKIGATSGEGFDAFMRRLSPAILRSDVHIAPQVDFVPPGATLLRYERLGEDWKAVQAAWPELPDLRRVNESERGPAADYASAAHLAACRALYADDYREFGYG